MGTRYSATFYASQDTNLHELATNLFEAVDRVDQQMSTWKSASDIHRLNNASIGVWVGLPRELMTVLETSLQIGQMSNGAFDICVGDLVSAWGFGAPALIKMHNRNASKCSPRSTGDTALELDIKNRTARKTSTVCLDLSGIAKGFGVDELARVMDEFTISSWLVGIDGEMRAKGAKPGSEPWLIAHERPDRNARDVMGTIELNDMAVATSGNYRHCVEVDGRLFSHTMNPKTAAPLDNDVASVSVLASTCMAADAWATAFMIAGATTGMKMAASLSMQVIFVLSDGEVISTLPR